MSKYIATLPLSTIERVQIYINTGRKNLAAVKRETGADYVMNGGLYNANWTACGHLRTDGYTYAQDAYTYVGPAWDTGPDIRFQVIPDESRRNYLSCVALLWQGKRTTLSYGAAIGGQRGRTALALAGDRLVLYCSGDGTADAKPPEVLRAELEGLGCTDAVMLDGGGSSQCDFQGKKITSSRVVQNLILVYLKSKEDKPVSDKKTVCLDPGHGVESPGKCSPDGSYYEHEFALDMGRRIKAHLERCGVDVVMTRTGEHCPTGKADNADLAKRAAISNQAGADLFVSLHSNAAGNGGWYDARGLMVYTSAGPETAERNRAARAILARMREAGITLHAEAPAHELYAVLAKTTAPACLIEFGFHTNKEDVALLKSAAYRDKLAFAAAKGVCDFLGVAWRDELAGEGTNTTASLWASEAWEKAKNKGILDGTDPQGALTREMCAVVLDRLGLL